MSSAAPMRHSPEVENAVQDPTVLASLEHGFAASVSESLSMSRMAHEAPQASFEDSGTRTVFLVGDRRLSVSVARVPARLYLSLLVLDSSRQVLWSIVVLHVLCYIILSYYIPCRSL